MTSPVLPPCEIAWRNPGSLFVIRAAQGFQITLGQGRHCGL